MKIYLVIKYHTNLSNKNIIERICNIAEKNHKIICGHRDLEKWGQVSFSENNLMEQVFQVIDESDVVLIEFSESGIGMGIEAGYAKAKNIPVYVMQAKGTDLLSTAMKGISSAWYEYETNDDIQYIFDSITKQAQYLE